ncbi:MAG: hypothetical protein ACYC5A_06110 [Thermoleophilia bacterium]
MNQRNNPLSEEDEINQRRCIPGDIFGLLLAGVIISLGLIFLETTGEMMVLLLAMISVIVFLMTTP